MKKTIALLLLMGAVIFLFAPLGKAPASKTSKTHFCEELGNMLNIPEGSFTADLEIEMPSLRLKSSAITSLFGNSLNLLFKINGGFSEDSEKAAVLVFSNNNSTKSSKEAKITDASIDGQTIYLNLRSLLSHMISAYGGLINYSLFFPADYIKFSFEELAGLSPRAAELFFLKQATVKCVSLPGSRLSNLLFASLKESDFKVNEDEISLRLDNAAFLKLSKALLDDMSEHAGEYADYILNYDAGENNKTRNQTADAFTAKKDEIASEVKRASSETAAALSKLKDINACISLKKISSENAYNIRLSANSEMEKLRLFCDLKLSSKPSDKIEIPQKAMGLENLLNLLDSSTYYA